jgi:hypothetical protein
MATALQQAEVNPRSNTATAWLTTRRFSLLLIVLVCVTYPEVILGEGTFFYRDFQLFAYPWAHYHRESFWRGEVPLWNPLSNCGLPFLAQWNTMTLYPGSLLYLLLPLSWSLGVFCLLHLVLAGLGMYKLALRWANHPGAASLAGVAFAFNGLTLNSLMWTNNIAALGWMPWVVLHGERSRRESGRKIVSAALGGTMQMLTGAPEIIFLTWLAVATLALADVIDNRKAAGQIFLRLFGLLTLVMLLSAIQLLPFLDLLWHSQRDQNFADARWSMPLWGCANFLVPLFFTFPWSQNVFFQYDQYWTSSYYIAISILTLAIVALWKVRATRVRLLGALLLLSILLAMGDHAFLHRWLKQVFPVLGFMRYPIKFVALPIFIVPCLAALAISWLNSAPKNSGFEEAQSKKLRLCFTLVCAVLGLIALILCYARFHPLYGPRYNHWPATLESGWTRSLFLIAFAGGALTLTRLRRSRLGWPLQVGLLLLVWLDVITHAPNQNPTLPRSAYQPLAEMQPWRAALLRTESRAMTTLPAESEMHQSQLPNATEDFERKRFVLYSNCNLLEGVPKVNGVFSLYLREAEEVSTLLYTPNRRPSSRLVDFLGVSHLTLPGKATPWHARTNFMPFISGGQQPVFVSSEQCLRRLQDPAFDPRTTVFLPLEARTLIQATNGGDVEIRRQHRTSHRIEFETSGRGLVILSQAYYHPWKAYVDGASVPLLRANHAFQAVEVPGGEHRVNVVYEDRVFYLGATISGLSLLACCASAIRLRKTKGSPE